MDFMRNFIYLTLKSKKIVYVRTPRVPEWLNPSNCPPAYKCLSASAIDACNRFKFELRELEKMGFSVDAEKISREMDLRILDEYKFFQERGGYVDWFPEDDDGDYVDSPYLRPEGGIDWNYYMKEKNEAKL